MNPSYNDSIISGITFDDLITTLQCNEQTIDKAAVTRVFNEILKIQMADAREILKQNMDFILEEAKR
jgi:hypothetical protein